MTLSELDGSRKGVENETLKGLNGDSDISANGLFDTSGNTSLLNNIYGVWDVFYQVNSVC
jgi:hypothetical protein